MDCIGGNFLCDNHFDYVTGWDEPDDRPWNTRCPIAGNAIDRTEQSIRRNFPQREALTIPEVARVIASFLRPDWER